jgi:hypothetical protein
MEADDPGSICKDTAGRLILIDLGSQKLESSVYTKLLDSLVYYKKSNCCNIRMVVGYIQSSFNRSSLRNGFYSYLNLLEPIDKLSNTEEIEFLKA